MAGRPGPGPMQAASGTRGALPYSGDDIDSDIALAESPDVGNQTVNASLPELINGLRDSGVFETYTGINLRGQIRENDTTPLQFKYLAADCRLYYTLANVYNFSSLWHQAANAMWNDSSLCVTGSQGYAASGNTTAAMAPPASPNLKPNSSAVDILAAAVNVSKPVDSSGLLDNNLAGSKGNTIILCEDGRCRSSRSCIQSPITCAKQNNEVVTKPVCLQRCTGPDRRCPGSNFECDFSNKMETRYYGNGSNVKVQPQYEGWCRPQLETPRTEC
ncbi:MAG: hypothetical protein M1821_005884 [Bathelium mastoideum]|nr:MAG: hypothetical protein M1821_005884 [Bathelium mastoideum]